jgi:hypothetical protein
MAEERCRHDLILGQCADCAPLSPGLARKVYCTAGGSVFHRTLACAGLLDGQRKASRRGKTVHPAVPVDVVDAMSDGLGACEVCFADYRPAPIKPKRCLIQIDGQWTPGTLIRWQRGQSGRWTGLVTYVVGDEQFTTMKDQDDLRPLAG